MSPTDPYARAAPSVMHYGETEPKGNMVLFMKLCESLAKRVDAKLGAVCGRGKIMPALWAELCDVGSNVCGCWHDHQLPRFKQR